jgi:hypothetical protein
VLIDQDRIDDLAARPSESLNVEIKCWINPDEPEGMAKIVKAVQAIRNRNGGFLVLGFDNKTLLPDPGRPAQVRSIFHLDKIQALVSRFSFEPFEIAVGFAIRDGQDYPVIRIPEGVVYPVAATRDLQGAAGNYLIRLGEVYFRTLQANGTPSTARARPNDWPDIMEICFQNREADIGRFFRRHLAGDQLETLLHSLTGVRMPKAPTLRDRAQALLEDGARRMQETLASRELTDGEETILSGLAWSIGMVVDPPKANAMADTNFLNAVAAANPQYTGWPVWLDSRNFDERSTPKVVDKAPQALILSLQGWSHHADFMRLDPKGEFYLWRVLPDDLSPRVARGTVLDPILSLGRVTEAIAVGLSIVKALKWDEDARLGFAFRWTKLHGRLLMPWANPRAHVPRNHVAHDDTVDTFVDVPLDTAVSAIAPYVEEATRDLFIAFNGYTLPRQDIEYWVDAVLKRQW